MTFKKLISQIFNPPAFHWVGNGFRVHNFIPTVIPQERISPFVMLDYGAKFAFPASNIPPGVGVHPHRGMETVTIAYKGKVAHHDSTGSFGIIGQGEVQWMTAGSGILHKEYHEQEFSKTGRDFQMVQLWVNLPAKHKMTSPKYQAITKDIIKKVELENKAGFIEIISGNYKGNIGPASTFSPINLWNVHLGETSFGAKKPNNGSKNLDVSNILSNNTQTTYANNTLNDNLNDTLEDVKLDNFETTLNIPEKFNTFMLVIKGDVEVNGQPVKQDQLVLFDNVGEEVILKSEKQAIILVASGQPINETIFSYGPFVMNTKQEIIQAFQDLEQGKFGVLE